MRNFTVYFFVHLHRKMGFFAELYPCLLYTSDAADERSSVDLGGRRIIKKKKNNKSGISLVIQTNNKRKKENTIKLLTARVERNQHEI